MSDNKQNRTMFVRHAALGDILFTTPFFKLIHDAQPSMSIDLYSLSREPVEGVAGLGDWIPMHEVSPKKALRRGHARIFWFSYEHDHSLHILDGYQISTGLKLDERTLVWHVEPRHRIEASNRLAGLKRPLIGFSPTSAHQLRTLSLAKIQEIVDIAAKQLGGTLVLTSDQRLEVSGCFNLTGELPTLQDLAAVISLCDVWVTVDSAPLHLAQALGTQAVGIFGCTLPELRATRPSHLRVVRNEALDCLGCYHRLPPSAEIKPTCDRGDLACMEAIDSGAVAQAIEKALRGELSQDLLDRMEVYAKYRASRLSTLPNDYAGEAVRSYQARISQFGARFGFFKLLERTLRQHRKSLMAWLLERG